MTSPEKEPYVWSLSTIKPVDVNLELDEVKREKALFYIELLHSTDIGGAMASVGEKTGRLHNVLTY